MNDIQIRGKDKSTTTIKYIIDTKSHKVIFSKNKININVGESFCLDASDLSVCAGDFLNYIDLDWNTKVFSFRGIEPGRTKIRFLYPQSNIEQTTEVVIANTKKTKTENGYYKNIIYKINQDANDNEDGITFSTNEIHLKKGQKFILYPDQNIKYEHKLLLEGEYFDFMDSMYLVSLKGSICIFKAITKGTCNIECHVAHSYSLKGTIRVTIRG